MNITISNQQLSAGIHPQGAELFSLKKADKEYMWEGNPEFWGKHSPVLFPIVGTLKNNTHFVNGKEYTMTRHGFARDNAFTVKELHADSVTFTLTSNKETKKQYPYNFELNLTYTLKDTVLHLEYTVKNTGNTNLPFSIGAHPAFALPGAFNNYSLEFEKEELLEITPLKNDLLTDHSLVIVTSNKELPLLYSLFENDALIFKALQSKSITIKHQDKNYLKVSFSDFPHLGIWTKQDAPFLCIEPWQGYSDSLEASGNLFDKEGIIILKPQTVYSASFNIEIL